MYKKSELSVKQLKKEIDLSKLEFRTTDDIQTLKSVIGQERAVSSIDFALQIEDSGYNIFITGSYGTGRTTIVGDLLKKAANNNDVPNDWIYVYNFKQPDEPIALKTAPGQATKFKTQMHKTIQQLSSDLKKAFESKDYSTQKSEIINNAQNQKQSLYNTVEKEALSKNIQLKSTSMGFVTIPLKDGKNIETKDFQNLPQKKQEKINNEILKIQKRIQEMVRQISLLDRNLQDKIEELNENIASYVVNNHFQPFFEEYKKWNKISEYLKAAAHDIVENVREFIGSEDEKEKILESGLPYKLNKYQVNVLILFR